MIFNIDEEMVTNTVIDALEQASSQASQDQFNNIVQAINTSFPGVIELITYSMQENWRTRARAVSTGWGEKYARAIKARVEGNVGEVYVDENMIDKTSNKPVMLFIKSVEEGQRSWSIKDALLASDKAKVSADGVKYITVPFPVAVPRRAGQGTMQTKFGGREMTEEMHKIVKAGDKLKTGTLKIKGREVNISGLTRYVTRQRHEQYGIFRRVSENSTGWQHPGVAAEPVFSKVLAEVNKQIQKVLSDFCKDIVREYTTS